MMSLKVSMRDPIEIRVFFKFFSEERVGFMPANAEEHLSELLEVA
jgi:hypothetical protein